MDDLCGVFGLLSGAYVALGDLALVASPPPVWHAVPAPAPLSFPRMSHGLWNAPRSFRVPFLCLVSWPALNHPSSGDNLLSPPPGSLP